MEKNIQFVDQKRSCMLQKIYIAVLVVFLTIGNLIFSADAIAQQDTKNTIIIEFAEGKVPLKGQLNLQIANYKLKFKKILRHDDAIILHHKDLYIYEFKGNPIKLKKILEDSLYKRGWETSGHNTVVSTLEGYKPEATDEHIEDTILENETEGNTESKNPITIDVSEDDMHRVSSFCMDKEFQVTFKEENERVDILKKYDVKIKKTSSMPQYITYVVEAKDVARAVSIVEQLLKEDFIDNISFNMFMIVTYDVRSKPLLEYDVFV